VSLALNWGAVATPLLPVPTVAVALAVVAKVPLGPVAGAVKVTLTPAVLAVTGQPLVLISWTWSGDWKLAPVLAVWGVPPAAVIALG
jgi:Flp pilus assembly protein protease CpaA